MTREELIRHNRYKLAWQYALAVALFSLTWQARFIFMQTIWNGGVWEYGTVGIYAVEIILWLSIVLHIWEQQIYRNLWNRISIHSAVFGATVAVWIVYKLAHTQFVYVQLQALVHIIEACLLIYLIIKARARAHLLIAAFIAGLAAQSIIALAQFFTQQSFAASIFGMARHLAEAGGTSVIEAINGRWLRAYGALPHPNILGGYLAIGALLIARFISGRPHSKPYSTRHALHRAGLFTLYMLFVAGMFVSFSRSAILAFAVGLVVLCVRFQGSRLGKHRYEARRFVGVIVGAVAVFGMFAVLTPELVVTRMLAQSRLEERSINERIGSFESAREVWKSNWLFGTGLGAYTATLYERGASFSVPGWDYQPVHNAFILALIELGLLMSVLFALAVVRPITRICASASNIELVFALVVLALFDHYLWSLESGLFLGAVVFGVWQSGVLEHSEESLAEPRRVML